MDEDQLLRKECLEWAFEKRRQTEVWHMEVTNVAEDYYRWIMFGESQGNLIDSSPHPLTIRAER